MLPPVEREVRPTVDGVVRFELERVAGVVTRRLLFVPAGVVTRVRLPFTQPAELLRVFLSREAAEDWLSPRLIPVDDGRVDDGRELLITELLPRSVFSRAAADELREVRPIVPPLFRPPL